MYVAFCLFISICTVLRQSILSQSCSLFDNVIMPASQTFYPPKDTTQYNPQRLSVICSAVTVPFDAICLTMFFSLLVHLCYMWGISCPLPFVQISACSFTSTFTFTEYSLPFTFENYCLGWSAKKQKLTC